MSTRKTSELYNLVRTRLLAFVGRDGETVGAVLGTRLFHRQAPADATYPYGVITFLDRPIDPAYNAVREVIQCELQLFDSPRERVDDIEDAADIADAALLRWRYAAIGLVFARERTRNTLPPDDDPEHRDTARVRCVYSLIAWPRLLTLYES
jgi:hypothetical protein